MNDVFIINNADGAVMRDERVSPRVIEQYYDCLDGQELDEAGDLYWIFPVYTHFGRNRITLGMSFPVSKIKNCVCCGLIFACREHYKTCSAAKAACRKKINQINKGE